MSYAPNYSPTVGFATEETNNVAGRATVRTTAIDNEFANVSSSINALNTNLKVLQRDDGKPKDLLIEPYALSEQTRALVVTGGNPRGDWVVTTDYAIGDVVQHSSIAYLCHTAHSSGGAFNASFWIAISGDGAAATHAIAAAASEAAAAASESAAEAAAAAALASQNAAASSQSAASTSATNAQNSATAAAASSASASGSASSASIDAASAAASWDSFDDRYLGSKASAPSVDNDGNALAEGALYWNSTVKSMWVWNGSSWVVAGGGGGATGSPGNPVFYENDQTVTGNYTITTNRNAVTAGPITINAGVSVVIPAGSTWHVL